MRCLNWYVTKAFLITFGMAILVLTFAMTGANLIKVLEFVSRGIPMAVFGKYMLFILPRILTFTVPWAVMVSVVLLFGRLSADNEITAMRACGVSIIQIISPILLITFLMTLLCLYLQVEIGPPLLWKSRSMMSNEAAERPMALFEPGSPFGYQEGNSNITISIDDRVGENELRGVHFCKTDLDGNILQEINATRGVIQANQEEMILYFTLYDCMMVNRSEDGRSGVSRGYAKEFRFPFNYGKEINGQRIGERAKYMPVRELLGEIRRTKQMNEDTTKLEIELNKRVAFALSPIAFLLLGMPLAIRTSRRETSIGLFISVILASVYFFSIILFESLDNITWIYPQYLLWIPNIVFQLLGAVMTWRISQR
ncbi:MAG: YjgP/YjgQ family permease [Lentisphaerae bacterium]|nr:YjgP/YjgQ family permease [Lentisphaerota bacterium]